MPLGQSRKLGKRGSGEMGNPLPASASPVLSPSLITDFLPRSLGGGSRASHRRPGARCSRRPCFRLALPAAAHVTGVGVIVWIACPPATLSLTSPCLSTSLLLYSLRRRSTWGAHPPYFVSPCLSTHIHTSMFRHRSTRGAWLQRRPTLLRCGPCTGLCTARRPAVPRRVH